jgi:uncharacterized membrane protein
MNKIKNALYGAAGAVVALAPAIAAAAGTPWDAGIGNASGAGTPGGSIIGIVATTMNWLLALVGFLGIIGFVIAGILYLTAAGDEDQIGKAKNAMMYSIIGVIVALLGFVVIQAVDAWLNQTANF